MARKKKLELSEDLDTNQDERSPVSKETVRRALSFTGWTFGLVMVVFGVAFAMLQGEQFLSTDARFRIPEEGYRNNDDSIAVRGVKNASKPAVLRVFQADRGRSLADVDPEQRRIALRRVEWVRDASVRRIWPNRLDVEIEERQPVAIVQVAASLSGDFDNPVNYKPMLIDAEGFLLQVNGPIPHNMPLLIGVREREDVEHRRRRVLRMQQVLEELKDSREHIQEVDVSDPENLRITYQIHDQQVILILGNESFQQRVATFLRYFEGIRDKLAPRAVLDVSMKNRINAITPLLEPRK
ncbi:MAG: FtsQ-type POTRA domain-containing protein [Bryobacterales bacterium]|nr:FtsQ-type POTRA domain-containing protein [Bryobacterales bacterium]